MDYRLVTERSHIFCPNNHVCFAAVLDRSPDAAAVRLAASKVMAQHPVLRGRVRLDAGGNAVLHIEAQAEPLFSTEPGCDWAAAVAREQDTPFDLLTAPLFRVRYLTGGEAGAVLVLCFHHILADGLSGVTILQDILQEILWDARRPAATARIPAPLLEDRSLYPGERLSPPMRALAGHLNRRWRESAAGRVFTLVDYANLLKTYGATTGHGLDCAFLEQGRAARLAALCRENSVTVNSLLAATLLEAAQEVTGDRRGNKKINVAAGLHPSGSAVGNFASGISAEHVYDRKRGLWENTRQVHRRLREKLDDERRKTFYLTFMKALDPTLIDAMYFNQYSIFENRAAGTLCSILGYTLPPKGLGFTNLGKSGLTKELGVAALYFIPPLVPNLGRIAGAVTTDTGLALTWQYNTQNAEEGRRIFERWVSILEAI